MSGRAPAMRCLAWMLVPCATLMTLSASAQDRYLVVPVAADAEVSLDDLAVVADDVRAQLRQQELDVLEPDVAAAVFEARVSTAAQRLTASQLDEIGTLVRDATRSLSTGDLQEAETQLERLGALRDAALEAVNRDATVARRALDGCLLGVRARLTANDAGGALELAERCRLAHPNVAWTENYHPNRVIEVYREAGRQVEARGHARVRIEIPDVGQRQCNARVNGVRVGDEFPVVLAQFRTGRASVQVECGDTAGRIHRVDLVPGDNRITIDPLLDEAVRTDELLGLQYADARRSDFESHLDTIRTTVRATHVVGVVVYGFARRAVSVQVRNDIGNIGVVQALRERVALHVAEAIDGNFTSYLNDPPSDIRADFVATQPSDPPQVMAAPSNDGSLRPVRWAAIAGLWAVSASSLWTAAVAPNKGIWQVDTGVFDGFSFSTGQKLGLVLGTLSLTTASVLTGLYGKRAGLHWVHYLSAGLLASAAGALLGAHTFRVKRRRFEERENCALESQCQPVRRFEGAQLGYFLGGIVAGAAAVGVLSWGIALDRRSTRSAEPSEASESLEVSLGLGRLHVRRRF